MERDRSASDAAMLTLAQVVPCTEAEGPGRRFAVWFQGCPLRCPGCCNPQMLPFEGGEPTSIVALLARIEEARDCHAIEGISLLGGEPMAHAEGAAELASRVQGLGLSVMVYSGMTIGEICLRSHPEELRLLRYTDILVDGEYRRELPEKTRRWVGSRNQRVHFLTDRYRADDPCWVEKNTLELRLRNGELTVNGFPAPTALGLWKRPKARVVS